MNCFDFVVIHIMFYCFNRDLSPVCSYISSSKTFYELLWFCGDLWNVLLFQSWFIASWRLYFPARERSVNWSNFIMIYIKFYCFDRDLSPVFGDVSTESWKMFTYPVCLSIRTLNSANVIRLPLNSQMGIAMTCSILKMKYVYHLGFIHRDTQMNSVTSEKSLAVYFNEIKLF